MEKPFKGLTVAEIVEANRRLVERFGGKHGVLNPGSLEHTLVQVQGALFGAGPLYPGTTKKAAFLCTRLAQGHFFLDGNKRTAFWCCKATLHLNGLFLHLDYADVESRMIALAEKRLDIFVFERWLIESLP